MERAVNGKGRRNEEDFRRNYHIFQRRLQAESEMDDDDRVLFHNVESWLEVEGKVYCLTEGCANQGLGYTIRLKVQGDGIFRASCGRCGNPSEKIVPMFEDGKGHELPTRPKHLESGYWAPREEDLDPPGDGEDEGNDRDGGDRNGNQRR
jgi:hypothetical protein